MATYLISYDLNKNKDYPKLWDELKRVGGHKILASVYLVNVNLKTSAEVCNWIKKYVDNDDSIVVVKYENTDLYYTNAKAGTNNWVENNKVYA